MREDISLLHYKVGLFMSIFGIIDIWTSRQVAIVTRNTMPPELWWGSHLSLLYLLLCTHRIFAHLENPTTCRAMLGWSFLTRGQ